MLFKNAFIYRLTRPFTISCDELARQLESRSFTPCSGLRPASFGWLPPTGDEEAPLAHEVAGSILLCARREDKIVPASALNEAVAERVTRLETLEGRKLNSKERLSLKEDALADLLPRALPRSKQILGYLSPGDDLLLVGTAVASEAELFLNCLRDSIEDFSVVPPQIKSKPADTFTRWLMSRKLPDHFALGDQCDLLDAEDGATINCRRVDLDTQEIRAHLENGKHCTRIGIRWHGDLRATVDKDLSLKQIKMESTDESMDEEADPTARLDATFAHMTLEFARFLPALFSALGGETRNSD
jgi:recombination associated protein RdgC